MFCTNCGYLVSLDLLLSEVDIILLQMKWDGGKGILIAVFL
jgi:hypothetical protein